MMWSKSDIRRARKVDLAPLLIRKGIHLKELPNDNFLVPVYDDLAVKKSYWTWPSRDLHGNAIDFFTLVQGLPFSQAMKILSAHIDGAYTESIQSDRNNLIKR